MFAGTTINPAAANMSSLFRIGLQADMTTHTAKSIRDYRAYGMVIFSLDQVSTEIGITQRTKRREPSKWGLRPTAASIGGTQDVITARLAFFI